MGTSIKQVFVTPLGTVSATDTDGAGVVRYDELGNAYRWVIDGGASTDTQPAGGAVCYEAGVRTSVVKPTTALLKVTAGIRVAATTGGQYGWILCQGVPSTVTLSKAATASSAAYLNNWEAQNGSYILKDLTVSPLGGGMGGLYGATYSTGSASSDTRTTDALWINCRL
jgi:hypothetical protein